MIDLKSYVDDLEIIYTGNAHVLSGRTLKINFDNNKIEINFLEDSNIEEKINWRIDEGVLKVTFQNYASSMGSGILHPWLIGDYKGRELYLTFFSRFINEQSAVCYDCTYVLYIGKEVPNE